MLLLKIVNESNRKPNKVWADQGRQFYNELVQEWLNNNVMSIIAEKFKKNLKEKSIKKYHPMIANLKYLNKLVDQYNNQFS